MKYIKTFESNISIKKDIIITIPKSIKWEDYEQELLAAKKGAIMNFKVPFLPKNDIVGSKCYLCYNGYIIGYMYICGVSDNGFKCTTTGKQWVGKFIQRSGDFYKIDPIKMRGFQGWRYFDINKY